MCARRPDQTGLTALGIRMRWIPRSDGAEAPDGQTRPAAAGDSRTR